MKITRTYHNVETFIKRNSKLVYYSKTTFEAWLLFWRTRSLGGCNVKYNGLHFSVRLCSNVKIHFSPGINLHFNI